MDNDRFGTLAAGIAEMLLRLNVTDQERNVLFVDPKKLSSAVLVAMNLLRASHGSAEKMAVMCISEAREIFGEEAAQQLLAQFAKKYGEGV